MPCWKVSEGYERRPNAAVPLSGRDDVAHRRCDRRATKCSGLSLLEISRCCTVDSQPTSKARPQISMERISGRHRCQCRADPIPEDQPLQLLLLQGVPLQVPRLPLPEGLGQMRALRPRPHAALLLVEPHGGQPHHLPGVPGPRQSGPPAPQERSPRPHPSQVRFEISLFSSRNSTFDRNSASLNACPAVRQVGVSPVCRQAHNFHAAGVPRSSAQRSSRFLPG